MIAVKRNEKTVELKIDVAVPYAGVWTFSFNVLRHTEIEAGFLVGAIEKKFGDYIQVQREAWYIKGWRDAKAHNKKRDWFPRQWQE